MGVWYESEKQFCQGCQDMVRQVQWHYWSPTKHRFVVEIPDNAGANKSHDIIEIFESVLVKNFFSTSTEQWQNGLAEAAVNSITMLSRAIMADISELGGTNFV